MIGAARKLDCSIAHIRLRELGKSEDKAEMEVGSKEWHRCRRGGSTDRKEIDADAKQRIVVPWYRRGGTSVESSIPCSHGGRALVVKRAKEVKKCRGKP
ncbi:hypothetical protein BHM03_00053463 [Ensete ventricosum]|nr:hypothetical protein BHM03_00053463 [Ensete ventricosum]